MGTDIDIHPDCSQELLQELVDRLEVLQREELLGQEVRGWTGWWARVHYHEPEREL